VTDFVQDPPRPDYHHGNLPAALVQAAREIVESQGVDALSLRRVARQAKVSHGAPYHHFAGKAELLAAVAADGFDQMLAAIRAEQAKYDSDDHFGRVVAVGAAYVTFARQSPAIFRLMFRPELTHPNDYPPLKEAEARTFGSLVDAIIACQQAGLLPGSDPLPPSLAAWSTVHGFATLWIEDVLAETPLGAQSFETMAPELLKFIMLGLAAPRPS
jgi:AcrR family transcriptional regulator